MKRIFFLAAFTSAFITLAVAQTHMFVWKNGMSTDYAIINVDSITFGNKSDASDTASKGIGLFSIGENKYVTFSKGNLQYHPKKAEWRFAFNQYDCIGDANKNISTDYDGWIDLFGWGTGEEPINYSVEYSDYPFFVDWGTNVIGTDAAYTWRTLSNSEWIYLFNSRPNARSLYGIAQVAGVNGMIILPDNWSDSIGINFKSGLNNNGSGSGYYAVYQSFTAEQWSIMEDAGAVFLPASGFRYGTEIYDFTLFGYYWHKTEYVSESAFYMYFDSGYFGTDLPILRYYGYSVRLAKDVFIDDTPNDPDEPSTPEDPDVPSEDGHEYVDLGLSVKWATCNVGANNPEEYGDYFAWGETTTKTPYDLISYKYWDGLYNILTKYNTNNSMGIVDNKNTLEMSDDVAHAKWGKDWRMPTYAEFTELNNKCTWTWSTQNGVNGYKVTSKSNGNSIFLPVVGYRCDSLLHDAINYGYYWSSSLDTDSPHYAYCMYFDSGSVSSMFGSVRYYGLSVRPVLIETTLPTLVTSAVTQITETTAITGGNVTNEGEAKVTERGVVYGTNQNPTTADAKNVSGSGKGEFICSLTDLQPNTTYYVRAYATNAKGTSYGMEVCFTTKQESSAMPEYIDLGLSVKWATFNVGASKAEDYGDHFAWGETSTKSTYDWSSYKYCNGSKNTLTKYNTSSSYGIVDNKTQLELSDDAARVNWGGNWRMPTDAEWTELREQCTWSWTTLNGINGYKVTSKSNGNSIFLPAAGYPSNGSLTSVGDYGRYWSSSLNTNNPYTSMQVHFLSSFVYRSSGHRDSGYSIRPVHP